MRPSWSSSVVLGEGMWDSGGCDASYPLTPVSPFTSLREEMPLGSVAVSSRGSGVSPLPLRRSLWSDFRGFCGHQRRQRAAHPPRCEHPALTVFPRYGSDCDRSILLERWTGRLFASRRGPSHSSSGPPPRFPCPSAGPLPFKGCDAVAESVSCRSPFPGYELSSPAHLYGNPMA